jgi:hypothetical protein
MAGLLEVSLKFVFVLYREFHFMKKRYVLVSSIFCLITALIYPQQGEYPLVSVPQTHNRDIPVGWLLGGSNPLDYAVGVDLNQNVSGYASAYLKSTSSRPVGFVTLMQTFKANNYRAQRVRLSAYIKTKFVAGWSALWMRVDDAAGKPLSFDDMRDRPLVGSSEWSQVEIVLDVPPVSDEISFGILLQGRGQLSVDNIKITIVNNNVPVTDVLKNKSENYSPKNLDFEE